MNKKELRKLRALPATKQMMEKGKIVRTVTISHWWDSEKHEVQKPEYGILLRVQNLSGYIKIAVFLPEWMKDDIRTPVYEVFLNPKGEEYLTRCLDRKGKEAGWSTAMFANLKGINTYGAWPSTQEKIYINQDGMKTLNSLELPNDKEKKGYKRLIAWQQYIRDENTKRKEKKEQALWDEDMKLVPALPKGFKEWMRKAAVEDVFIIYEYDRKKQKVGYCSRCKKLVPIVKPRHNKNTKCPACKVNAKFKSSGKTKTLWTNNYYAEIIQKMKGGIVIRSFRQVQSYHGHAYTDPFIGTYEERRVLIFDDGRTRKYDWAMYKNKFHRWVPDKGYITVKGRCRTKLYKRNLSSLRNSEVLKQSAIELWPELPMSASAYLALEKGNPAIEQLAKLGMFRMAKGMIEMHYDKKIIDQNQTELVKLLRIDGSRLKRLKDMDANIGMLKWMQYEKLVNTIWPDEMIKDYGDENIGTSDFNFLHVPIKFVKCYNYLKKQAELSCETMHQTLITWRDYTDMADQMKMNTKCDQIARPKNLKGAHDELILLREQDGIKKQAKQIAKKWPKVNKQLHKLKKFEYTEGDYTIIAPAGVEDIVQEGTILRHCVHTCDYYFDRIQRDESYLFFLRHSGNPSMPWYTLEVEPSGNIRQKRTTGDNQNADFQKAVGFLKKWQAYFKKQLSEEEKELGVKANQARIDNYKNLRKNQNRVWHGKLAGQLLADVLEADFMEAM